MSTVRVFDGPNPFAPTNGHETDWVDLGFNIFDETGSMVEALISSVIERGEEMRFEGCLPPIETVPIEASREFHAPSNEKVEKGGSDGPPSYFRKEI